MNHRKESTGIDNFGQFGHHWFTLIGGEALFNTTSGKAINFGWPKCGGFVPKSEITEYFGFGSIIYN
jgi:hypothetical protein